MGYSFIIPVYNCRETLADCVSSIRRAGLPDYEVLLIDDGSTDGSAALCDTLAEKFPEIRAFHQLNAGVSVARNRGLAAAAKARILFADGDDVLDSEALREVVAATGDLVIFGMAAEYFHRGVCYGQELWRDPRAGRLNWQRELEELFRANVLSSACNKVFSRHILEKNRIRFREDMDTYEDLEFVLRYLKHCERVINLPQAAYRYRISPGASERIRRMGAVSEFLQPLEDALADLSLPRKIRDAVRLRLFEILAWEKCGTANAEELCRDFRDWYETLEEKPEQPSKLVQQMLRGRGRRLKLRRKCILLRHTLAVEVKTWMKMLR